MEETPREDYDSPWEEMIERFFERFMAFYFSRAHRLIAWDEGFEFLLRLRDEAAVPGSQAAGLQEE